MEEAKRHSFRKERKVLIECQIDEKLHVSLSLDHVQEVQLDKALEIEKFHILLLRYNTKHTMRSNKHHIKYFNIRS